MEDLHTIKNHYAYQCRVDLSHNPVSEEILSLWIDHFNISSYLFGREYKNNSIPHYQGIVWFESKLSSTQMCSIRNWFRNKTLKSAGNGHSFTSARKVTNLARYCKKDGNYWTNLSSQQIESLGNWDTKHALKLQKAEKLEKMVKNHMVTPMTFLQFLKKFDDIYWHVYGNNPTRNTIYKWARITKSLSKTEYYQKIGLLYEHEVFDTYSQCLEIEKIYYGPEQMTNEENEKYDPSDIKSYYNIDG